MPIQRNDLDAGIATADSRPSNSMSSSTRVEDDALDTELESGSEESGDEQLEQGDGGAVESREPAAAQATEQQTDDAAGSATTQAAAAARTFRERLAERGVPVYEGADEDQVAAHVAQLYRDAQDIPRLRQIAQQFEAAERARLQNEQMRQSMLQQNGQAGAQQAAKPKRPWNLPEYDETWNQLVKTVTDPTTGEEQVVPINNYVDQSIPAKLAAYQSALAETARGFFTSEDPVGTLMEGGLADRVEQMVQERIAQAFQQRDQQAYLHQAVNEDTPWMYQRDAKTGSFVTDLTGNRIPTQEGQAYLKNIELLDSLVRSGANFADPAVQRAIAQSMTFPAVGQQQTAPATATRQTQQPAAATVNTTKQVQRRAATRNGGSRGGAYQNNENGRGTAAERRPARLAALLEESLKDVPDDAFQLPNHFE